MATCVRRYLTLKATPLTMRVVRKFTLKVSCKPRRYWLFYPYPYPYSFEIGFGLV